MPSHLSGQVGVPGALEYHYAPVAFVSFSDYSALSTIIDTAYYYGYRGSQVRSSV